MATPPPAGTYTSYKQNNQFLSDRIAPVVQEEKLYIPPATTTRTTRNIFIGAVAVCLLLGGIIIGLLISGNKVSQEQRELSARIKQIQERENAKRISAVNTNTTPQTGENSADMTIIPVSSGNAEPLAETPTTEKEAINTNKNQIAITGQLILFRKRMNFLRTQNRLQAITPIKTRTLWRNRKILKSI